MERYALLCGSAPEGMNQKKIVEIHNFLVSKEAVRISEKNIVLFPNGIDELLLESMLNASFDWAKEEENREVLLYLCASHSSDLSANLSDSCVPGVEVVKLGKYEIRKEVLNYYTDLAKKLDFNFSVFYECDCTYLSEEWAEDETVSQQEELC